MERLIRTAWRRVGWALLVACCACTSQPSAPTPASVAGTYSLIFTPCSLSGAPATSITFVCGSQNLWTVVQNGSDVSGLTKGQCAPFNYSGRLTATMLQGNRIEISAFAYTDSSTHSAIRTISGTATAGLDGTGFGGTLAGDYSETPTDGGSAGPTASCHGTQMAFRFIRQP